MRLSSCKSAETGGIFDKMGALRGGGLMRTILALIVFCLAGAAYANPDPCPGALPRSGATFGGVVRAVLDGDTVCVSEKPYFKNWTKVRLADFSAPELTRPGGAAAQATLEDIAMGQRVVCVSRGRSLDRAVARCTIVKKSLGDFMRDAGVEQSGDR